MSQGQVSWETLIAKDKILEDEVKIKIGGLQTVVRSSQLRATDLSTIWTSVAKKQLIKHVHSFILFSLGDNLSPVSGSRTK